MKSILIVLAAVLLAGCASTPLEALSTQIDSSDWKVGFQKDFGEDEGYIREFVPQDETIDSWTKLVSVEFLEGELRPLRDFVSDFSAQRSEQCPDTQMEILSESEYTITYQFSFPECMGHQAQSEVTRIYTGNDGLHRLSYAEKTSKLSEETIKQWLAEFDKAYIVKGPNKARIR
ncbi:hypothetical protein CWE08_08410 [Aliidiomarina iranensis]|uniref:Lipoprotein n=1 Tax=Aliidiomarina iranensis TaxID=1434071 RepID=A0A432VVF6_9GAMM|nr:hypothetical protein [Aliidiomarina iranensis]RUO20475.1 hypothetical protein CWE08_08410 [Aliidiomarina iranensis]